MAFVLVVVTWLSLGASPAGAAPITLAQLNDALTVLEPAMEDIFGVSGSILTNINFLSPVVVHDPGSYLNIDTAEESLNLLFSDPFAVAAAAPKVTAYFVEAMSICGFQFIPGLIGCASLPGNTLMLTGAAMTFTAPGAVLFDHELGHNLGLSHQDESDNLMYPFIGANRTHITGEQLATINSSSLIVRHTVTILPVLLAPSATIVPEPSTAALVLGGFMLMAANRKRLLAPESKRHRFVATSQTTEDFESPFNPDL